MRTEDPATALLLDRRIWEAYQGFRDQGGVWSRIDNSTDWRGKVERIISAVSDHVGVQIAGGGGGL